MFTRLFTLTERAARLVSRSAIWLGNEWLAGIANISGRLPTAPIPTSAPESNEGDRVRNQVRTLSGLIIGLLAAVVLLLLWATNPRASVSPVINLFNLITPAAVQPEVVSPGEAEIGALPDPLQVGGTVAFDMRVNGQDDLYAITIGVSQPTRLTSHPADDRDPAWSPDGEKLAFASRRDGNWELYILDIITGELTRLTFDLAYEAAPSWSPDGAWLAYEAYRDGNLDIYIIRVDGSEGPFRLTFNPAPDFEPAWTKAEEGREIAYVSSRDGNQEIYILSLDDPREDTALNITNTPDTSESHPAWSPGGLLLAYSAESDGRSLALAKPTNNLSAEPQVIGQGRDPAWSPDGAGLIYAAQQGDRSYLLAGAYGSLGVAEEAIGLVAPAENPDWSPTTLPDRLRGSIAEAANTTVVALYEERLLPPVESEAPYRLINLEGVDAPVPYLSDSVDDSFVALRARVAEQAGWDVLGRADHIWWEIDRPVDPGQDPENWHKAGRAFDLAQGYIEGNTPLLQPVMEQQGIDIRWRLYIRTAQQDGSQGEPLRELPWDFTARWSGDVEAYDRGGRTRNQTPDGYYVDFTQLAADYGWYPVPSHSSWRSNWSGVLFWQYEKRDAMNWQDAMLQIYPAAELAALSSDRAPLPTSEPPPEPTLAPVAPAPTPTPALEGTPDPDKTTS